MQDDIDFLAGLWDWQGLRVVDIGCGRGQLCTQLAALGADVSGVEPDAGQRAAATTAVPIHAGGADTLPLETGTVDVALFNRSLHHVPAPLMDAALTEAARVLRPDGRLVVLEPDIGGQMSQVMAPFHDEQAVRAAAQAAMARFTALPLHWERWYPRRYTFPDLVTFKARMRAAQFIEIDHVAVDSPLVAARFAAGETADGFVFTNPIQVRLYAHP